ncbi:hypothetical protein AOLI_G00205230 [Acnodon oligacanthus]
MRVRSGMKSSREHVLRNARLLGSFPASSPSIARWTAEQRCVQSCLVIVTREESDGGVSSPGDEERQESAGEEADTGSARAAPRFAMRDSMRDCVANLADCFMYTAAKLHDNTTDADRGQRMKVELACCSALHRLSTD